LLTEGKLKNYVFYALGEILLVMVGILLALQVNNWNEGRKAAKFEQSVLRELHTSLQNNIGQLDWAIRVNKDALASCDIILKHFEARLPYTDTLDHHFQKSLTWFYPSIKNNAYESLKSYGLYALKNDSIRVMLGEIYENIWLDVLAERQEAYYFNTVSPMLTEWFESNDYSGDMKPFDFEELRASRRYGHILRSMRANRKIQIRYYTGFRDGRRKLADMIERELYTRRHSRVVETGTKPTD